jgi:hypothetical protein
VTLNTLIEYVILLAELSPGTDDEAMQFWNPYPSSVTEHVTLGG